MGVQEALQAIYKLPPKERLAALAAIEQKRKEQHFLRYWEAFPKQAEVFREWTPGVKVFGILGGNRSAKTETGAVITLAWLLGKDYFRGEPSFEYVQHLPIPDKKNINSWMVGLDYPTLKDVIWREKLMQGRNHPGLLPKDDEIIRKINEADMQVFTNFEGREGTLTGKSAESGREKFQSASLDFIWFDEECEKDVFDEGYQRTVDCSGVILLTLTPLIDISSGVRTPWVYDLYQEWKKGDPSIKFVKLSVLDNPHVPDTEKTRLKAKWEGHPEERARLYGDFVQRSGLVYYMWNPKKHLVDPFEIPRDWPSLCIIDPAPTGPTAALLTRVAPNGDYYFVDSYKKSNQTVSQHSKDILVWLRGRPVDIWGIDPKGGSQRNPETHKTIAQLYRENNIPVRLLELPEDYGVEASREYLLSTTQENSRQNKAFVFKSNAAFIDEIEHYVWATFGKGEMKGMSKEKPVKRNDHIMNCMQYACAMRMKGTKKRILTPADAQVWSKNNSYT